MKFPITYQNGNVTVTIQRDGTRIITCEGDLALEYPLNIDVRLSRRCDFGFNPNTGKGVCSFCHESARTDGAEASIAQIDEFFQHIKGLPRGTELALGVNSFTPQTKHFLECASRDGYIVNVTVNQGHLPLETPLIDYYIKQGLISGLGVSYRKFGNIRRHSVIIEYPNIVFHVIAGIDDFDSILKLHEKGVKKILILGEKDFGFNLGKVDLTSDSHKEWFRRVHELFAKYDVVSFDNLALEQLRVRRFVKDWETMYQHEFSFYANIVDGTFSPSSRSPDTQQMKSVAEYFKTLPKSVI